MARYCLIILCVNVLWITNVFGQSCPDCRPVTSCAAASELLNTNDPTKLSVLRNNFCGWQGQMPKVCCSNIEREMGTDSDDASAGSPQQHRNFNLLPKKCGYIDGERVVGGETAGLYEFPWMALISYHTRDGLQFQCGGTVINDRYILTAAHCIKGGRRLAGVRIGEFDTSTKNDCQNMQCESVLQDLPIEKQIAHEEYKSSPVVINDIALLRLAVPINLSLNNSRPVCLPVDPTKWTERLGGKKATVTGWGATGENGNGGSSNVLQKVQIPIYTEEACVKVYQRGRPANADNSRNKLCAGELGKDSCRGDSGGPLMLNESYGRHERYNQIGIVSYGPAQCGSDFPGVYTDVRKYVIWILDHMQP